MNTSRALFLAAACATLLAASAFGQVQKQKPAPVKSGVPKSVAAKPAATKPTGAKPILAQPIPAQTVPAQAPVAPPEAAEEGGANRLELDALRGRYRPSIHPGEALVIVGNEQGDNDLRSITPSLARGEHAPQLVDTDENYQRALAMYGDGQMFHTPPRSALGAEPQALEPRQHPARPNRPVAAQPEPKAQKPEAAPWSVLAGLLVSALLITWFLVRVRPSLMAPEQEAAQQQPEPFVWNPARRVQPRPSAMVADPAAALPRPAQVASKQKQR